MWLGTVLGLNLSGAGWEGLVSTAIYLPLLVLSLATRGRPSSVMLYLGAASYSIYLFHPHFESALLGVAARLFPHMPLGLVFALISVSCVVLTCLVYSFMEVPLTRGLKEMVAFRTRKPRSTQA